MGKIIVHKLSNEALTEKRQLAFFGLSYSERFKKTIELIRANRLFSNQTNLKNRNKIIIKE